jgi:hypothetical protein
MGGLGQLDAMTEPSMGGGEGRGGAHVNAVTARRSCVSAAVGERGCVPAAACVRGGLVWSLVSRRVRCEPGFIGGSETAAPTDCLRARQHTHARRVAVGRRAGGRVRTAGDSAPCTARICCPWAAPARICSPWAATARMFPRGSCGGTAGHHRGELAAAAASAAGMLSEYTASACSRRRLKARPSATPTGPATGKGQDTPRRGRRLRGPATGAQGIRLRVVAVDGRVPHARRVRKVRSRAGLGERAVAAAAQRTASCGSRASGRRRGRTEAGLRRGNHRALSPHTVRAARPKCRAQLSGHRWITRRLARRGTQRAKSAVWVCVCVWVRVCVCVCACERECVRVTSSV